ncbi:PH domain-containing protein [uncultured Winogradskyella sp.]|uniref:PH domain-containing protein n=1 Tax=uncultured Winogradskyella sp. TaxID=395353 RepID=UPI0026293383|nr:PH domain-containing protein [uncultured Winogradskyella sp.]
MNGYNFEQPSRQSIKGIIVIFGVTAYKIIKGTIVVIAVFLLKYIRSDKNIDFLSFKTVGISISIILLFLIIAFLKYLNFQFYVKDDHFFLKKGIFNKEEISVASSKIQNVYIKQNLLQQLINVVSLSIETAGDDKTEIEILALPKVKANALKAYLLQSKAHNDRLNTNSLEEAVFYKASVKKLFLEGISENHFKSFVLIFAFIIGIYNDVKAFVEQLDLNAVFGSWFQLDEESLVGLLLFNISIVVALFIISFLFSLVMMFIKNFKLTVKQKEEGLEISKGLFNKINLALSASRIQNTTIYTNKLKQVFGLYKLSFTQAMANKKQQRNFNIVGLNRGQISELLHQFYPKVEGQIIKNRPNIYMLYRLVLMSTVMLVIINVLLFFWSKLFLLINIPLILYLAANAFYTYKKSYYHLDNEYIAIGGGRLIDTTTSFLEIKKTQAVSLNQTLFQKQRGLASVTIYSASKSVTIPHINLADAYRVKDYLLYKVEHENKNWM